MYIYIYINKYHPANITHKIIVRPKCAALKRLLSKVPSEQILHQIWAKAWTVYELRSSVYTQNVQYSSALWGEYLQDKLCNRFAPHRFCKQKKIEQTLQQSAERFLRQKETEQILQYILEIRGPGTRVWSETRLWYNQNVHYWSALWVRHLPNRFRNKSAPRPRHQEWSETS